MLTVLIQSLADAMQALRRRLGSCSLWGPDSAALVLELQLAGFGGSCRASKRRFARRTPAAAIFIAPTSLLAHSAGNALTMSWSRRAVPAPTSACLYGLLQLCENPSISEQGCANAAGYSGRWAILCEPNSRRITSSVRSDLIYDRDRG